MTTSKSTRPSLIPPAFGVSPVLSTAKATPAPNNSGVTAPIRVSLGEMEASWPPELVLRVTGIPVGAVTDIVELPGMLAMYQVAAREGEDFTLRVLALPLPTPNEALDDYLLLWRREEAYWAWFEEACHRHRVRCPLFPDLAPAQ